MSILAFDLGASSGRAMIGRLDDHGINVEEIHRFSNDPVRVGNRLQWDILRLYHEIKQGLIIAGQKNMVPGSIGIDSWAVDFGLIDEDGELLGNPYHYRDAQTGGMMEEVLGRIPAADLFGQTGIQFLPFNTIYQLVALKKFQPSRLASASRLLMIPDLLRYFLTGETFGEFTNATTTQLYNPLAGQWDGGLMKRLGIPGHIFPAVLQPGMEAGGLRPTVKQELGIPDISVYTVAEHDTGSAVVAVPALEREFAYLSCGTWSLMGTEVRQPVISGKARELNFTNEGGAYGSYRLLKNIMGLWILQESRRAWEKKGLLYSFPELVKMAQGAAPFKTYIDPDDELFLPPGDMPSRIREYAARTSQPVPAEPGEVVRCILESLALKYRMVLDMTEDLSGNEFSGLYMVGGGIHNEFLCQWTANAIGKPVWAGPAEGSAIGNLAVQWIARGEVTDIWEARRLIRRSFGVKTYDPELRTEWEEAYGQFQRLLALNEQIQK
ncbi:rhamnulokinase [Paenibacillus sp. DMB20]|uniref:rhamnulokinase n=1 Tax=Paenibacillus sp. DMB20 TaxID=1642570 RepID=UPI000627F3B7|nr:rhamnulokinase family protein [Paenibacillus sp. DMB20]KKO53420.1 carbohydrate kinase [Paenibacillus sp. DMB20]